MRLVLPGRRLLLRSLCGGLIKDVSYAQIPRAARVQKHRAMAAWIEERAGDRVADHAEVLG
jgi:predicted ATPase